MRKVLIDFPPWKSAFKVDMTEFNEEHKTLIERYGGTAIPYAVLISKQGKVTQTFSGMFTSESMKGAILGVDRSAGSKTYTPGSIRE